jgi:hypothetical protein
MKKNKHEFFTNTNDIINWLESHGMKRGKYVIHDDLSVSVNGNVLFSEKKLTHLPIQFNHILGNFDISSNQLTSLKGVPRIINGDFHVNDNQLTTIDYSPIEIGNLYDISFNKLSSLGHIKTQCGIFQINDNPLELNAIKYKNLKNLSTKELYISSQLYQKLNYKTEDGTINFNIDPDYIEVSFERLKNFLQIKEEKQRLENIVLVHNQDNDNKSKSISTVKKLKI